MAVEVQVFLKDDRLPTHSEWQRAINERGIDLVLQGFSTRDQVGFVPAKMNGQDCGFEYSFGPAEHDGNDELQAACGDRDELAQFVWHSSQLDGAAAAQAAVTLAAISDGVFFDCSLVSLQ